MSSIASRSSAVSGGVVRVLRERLGTGPFTAQQVYSAGLSRGQLQQLIADGTLKTVLYGVYAEAAGSDDVLHQARAVALILPPGGIVGRSTAAWLL